ncbi:MAG: hypothetical protein LHV69_02415 [Elusimicrobia bacterium]|nr:hypothetical protein [Candidatus Obscuribacterium magneticum]MCB4755877.1 hypothetical protein [Candidatus Obscuribacterium magneticum]
MKKLIILTLLLSTGCATTSFLGIQDPSYSQFKPRKILVFSLERNLLYKTITEDSFAGKLLECGVESQKSVNIFLPTRNYSEKEIKSEIENKGFDSILTFSKNKEETKDIFYPMTTTTSGHIDKSGRFSSTSQNVSGHSVISITEGDLQLIEIKSLNKVWVGSFSTVGKNHASYNTIVNSISSKALNDMIRKGIIPQRMKELKYF